MLSHSLNSSTTWKSKYKWKTWKMDKGTKNKPQKPKAAAAIPTSSLELYLILARTEIAKTYVDRPAFQNFISSSASPRKGVFCLTSKIPHKNHVCCRCWTCPVVPETPSIYLARPWTCLNASLIRTNRKAASRPHWCPDRGRPCALGAGVHRELRGQSACPPGLASTERYRRTRDRCEVGGKAGQDRSQGQGTPTFCACA